MNQIYLSFVFSIVTLVASAQQFSGESVEYDPAENRFFSSQNGSSIVQRAANGTTSYFGNGLQASYGMEVMNNTLFAIEGSKVYGYDLLTETQVMEVTIPGAAFLNGMASDGESRLWVTDFSAGKIHEIDVADYQNPASSTVVANTNSTPNGIVYDGDANRLVFVNWGSNAPIKQVDLADYSVSTLTQTSLGNIDGIDNDAYGNFYTASWSPARITRFNSDFTTSETITAPGISSPADICYAQEIDTLAIPNGNGIVTFVGFSPTTSIAENTRQTGLAVGPNPLNDNSEVQFYLNRPQTVRIVMHSATGQEVQVFSGNMVAGTQRVLLAGFNFSSGLYVLGVETEDGRQSATVLVE